MTSKGYSDSQGLSIDLYTGMGFKTFEEPLPSGKWRRTTWRRDSYSDEWRQIAVEDYTP